MKQRQWLIILSALVLLTMLALPGCTGEEPAPATAPATAPAPAERIELKAAFGDPPVAPIAAVRAKWAETFNAAQDKYKVTIYSGETLVKGKDQYSATQSGIADLSFGTIGSQAGEHDLNFYVLLPVLGFKDMESGSKIINELWDKYPELRNEFKGLEVFGLKMMPANQLHTVKKAVRVPEDMAGMKIMMGGTTWKPLMDKVGAAPLSMVASEWATSLERGLADGHLTHYPVIRAFKTLELFDYHTIFGLGGAGMTPDFYIINSETYNSMPADIQTILGDTLQDAAMEALYMDINEIEMAMKEADEMGHETIYLTPEELKVWQDAFAPLHQQWIADFANKGPTQGIYDECKRLIAEY